MKVILLQDVKKLGKKNDMVKVNDGYAKNFLIPKGLVVEATNSTVNEMEIKNKAEKNRKDNELSSAEKLAEKIKGLTISFKSKAGDNGKLFGSITSKDISERLKEEHKINIDKRKIQMSDAIKALGVHEVEIKVYAGVTAQLKVKVESE